MSSGRTVWPGRRTRWWSASGVGANGPGSNAPTCRCSTSATTWWTTWSSSPGRSRLSWADVWAGQAVVDPVHQLGDRTVCRVERQVGVRPVFVVVLPHLGPLRQAVAVDVRLAGDDPPLVLRLGAGELDLQEARAGSAGDVPPGLTGDFERVDRVGDHVDAELQLVRRDGVCRGVPLRPGCSAVRGGRLQQRLLDGVHPHVRGATPRGPGPGEGGLASARESAENEQHGCCR